MLSVMEDVVFAISSQIRSLTSVYESGKLKLA